MRVRILRGGKFTHPDPKRWNKVLKAKTGDEVDVDEIHGARLIEIGRAELIDNRVLEVHGPEIIEEPPAAVVEEPEPPKKRRGRPPGKRKKL